MRVIVSMVLIAVLATDQLSAQQPVADSSIKQEIATLPSTALVEVRLVGGDSVRGHIINRTENDFSLQREKGGGRQNIAYGQVLSVSQVKGGHSHKKWILIGVIVGALVVIVVVVVAVAKTKGPFAL